MNERINALLAQYEEKYYPGWAKDIISSGYLGRMIKAFQERDYAQLSNGALDPENKFTRSLFTVVTGLSLPSGVGATNIFLRNWAANYVEYQKAQERAKLERKAKEREELERARIEQLRTEKVQYNGRVMSRAEWIESLVKEGYTIATEEKQGAFPVTRAENPDGSYYTLRKKIERDYYKSLLAQ